jgi:hypothetical protein
MIDIALTNGLSMFFMQLGARNVQFQFTDAQKKILQHPYTQVFLMTAMFYAPTRNIVLSILLVLVYYVATRILLNEVHPLNIYSKRWLVREGFSSEDIVETMKKNYMSNLTTLS